MGAGGSPYDSIFVPGLEYRITYLSRVAHTVRVGCGCAICPVVSRRSTKRRCAWCGRFTAGAATLSWSAERALRKENGSGSKFAGALKEIELVVNLGIGTPGKSGSGGGGSESPVVSTPNSRLPSLFNPAS